MFLPVGVLACDQTSLRSFLWREGTTSDVVNNQYTRHTLGASQSLANNISIYTEAPSVGNEKLNMDDYLDLFEEVSHAIRRRREMVFLL